MQATHDVHTWGDRVREIAETMGAVAVLGGVALSLGVAHVDRWLFGWLKRNKARATAEIAALLDEHLQPVKQLPMALDRLTRATRANARATRAHTRSMSSLSDRVRDAELDIAALKATKHRSPET
jgi:hypothetical protein